MRMYELKFENQIAPICSDDLAMYFPETRQELYRQLVRENMRQHIASAISNHAAMRKAIVLIEPDCYRAAVTVRLNTERPGCAIRWEGEKTVNRFLNEEHQFAIVDGWEQFSFDVWPTIDLAIAVTQISSHGAIMQVTERKPS